MKGRPIPPYPAERIAAARATFEQHGDAMLAAAETLPRLVRLADGRKLPKHVNVHHLRHTAAKFYTDVQAPDIVRVALAGHSPKTITDYYGEPDIETLRPWVERVYLLLTQADTDERQAA